MRLDPALADRVGRRERPWWPSRRALPLAVLAHLNDPGLAVPGLMIVRRIGPIITGAVHPQDITRVRAHPNVHSLKLARPLKPALHRSVASLHATPLLLSAALGTAPTGSGVIVGVVDDGCDFAHLNFRRADLTSRLLYLWDQGAGQNTPLSPLEYRYGKEYTGAILTHAARQQDPYSYLKYQPRPGAHGTHVTDIAAGNGLGTGVPGVAPEADLIFVQLGLRDYEGPASMGNSARLLDAVDYIFTRATSLGRPAVVNLSVAMNGGPHDGTSPVDIAFEHLLKTPGRAIVIAAGNTGSTGTHASGAIASGASRTLTWNVHSADTSDNELELWYASSGELQVALTSPAGHAIGPVAPNTPAELRIKNKLAARIESVRSDPNNGDHQISIFLRHRAPSGSWSITLTATADATFHAWIERDDFENDFQQSRFAPADRDDSCTLNTIGCGSSPIVVSAYDPDDPALLRANFSSRGPTRTGAQKPDLAAPGAHIGAAAARKLGLLQLSGTSQAAPHVTGVVALLFEAVHPRYLTTQETRAALMSTAATAHEWQPDDGVGPANCAAAILHLGG